MMAKVAHASGVLAPIDDEKKCATKGTDLEQLLNFTQGLAEHLNNYPWDHPAGGAQICTALGLVELTAMQVVRFDLEERLGQDYVYLAGNDYTGPGDYFTQAHDR